MIDLKECSTLQIMPEVLRKDVKVQAASYALQQTAQMLLEKIARSSVYAAIDILPEEIVDLLAVELRAQYYDTSLPVEDKREAVKKALPWHCKAGTVAAVKELTNFIWKSSSATVQEWFDYGSDPYLFRIMLDTDMCMDEEKIEAFIAAMWKVKNTRSHLESITFRRRIDHKQYIGAGVKSTGRIVITDVWRGRYEMHRDMHMGVGRACTPQRIRIREG